MSLHNLATVFGPTLLRPAEKDSKIPTNPTQPITMGDSWSLEVMSQVVPEMNSAALLNIFKSYSLKTLSLTWIFQSCAWSSDSHDTWPMTPICFCIRSKSCCTSSSLRLFPHRTVRDRASCFPQRSRIKHANRLFRKLTDGWERERETPAGHSQE